MTRLPPSFLAALALLTREQIAFVCEQLKGIPELHSGFDAMGFSQGGQFLRYALSVPFAYEGVDVNGICTGAMWNDVTILQYGT